MVKKYIAIVGIAFLVLVFFTLSLIDFEEPELIETKNSMIFGNSGQGEDRGANTGKMVKVIVNG